MVDCGGTENFTIASQRGRRKKGGGRLGGGRFLASSIYVPTYCQTMHTAMHMDVAVRHLRGGRRRTNCRMLPVFA